MNVHCEPIPEIWPGQIGPDDPPEPPPSYYIALESALLHYWPLYNDLLTAHSIRDLGVTIDDMASTAGWLADDYGTDTGSARFEGSQAIVATTGATDGSGMGPKGSILLWAKVTDKSSDRPLFTYSSLGLVSVNRIYYRASDDRFVAEVRDQNLTITEIVAQSIGSPSVSQWYGFYLEIVGREITFRVQTGRGSVPLYVVLAGSGTAEDPYYYLVTYPYGTATAPLPTAHTATLPTGMYDTGLIGRFMIGVDYVATPQTYHYGFISAVGVWDRPLNSLEISDLFHHDLGSSLFFPAEYTGPSNDLTAAIPAPTDLIVTGASPATVSWTDNTDGILDRHEVYRDSGDGSLYRIATLEPGAPASYQDATGDAAFHSYMVRAVRRRQNPSARATYSPPLPAFTFGAPDNLIDHGTDFANWTVDANSSKSAAGIVLTQTGTSDQARYDVAAPVSTEYWMRIVTDSKSAGFTGNVRLVALADTGCEVAGTSGALVNFGSGGAIGTFIMKVKTGATQATPGVSRIVLKHATSPDTNWVRITEVTLYPIPVRSSAKICVLGDRTAGYNGTVAANCTTAILAATGGDAVNVIAPGDLSDGTNALAINDTLKDELIVRGGDLFAAPGNWDYSAAAGISAWNTYFGLAAGQSNRYRSAVMGECEVFFYDTNTDNTDNGGQTSVAAAQASTMGAWLLAALAASTARWKIVVIHHPAHSSSTHHGGPSDGGGWPSTYAAMQWDWAALGVPLVIQSHDHVVERMLISGASYYTFALSGGSANSFGAPIAESEYRSTTAGYLKLSDTADDLVIEHFDVSNNLLNRYKITRS